MNHTSIVVEKDPSVQGLHRIQELQGQEEYVVGIWTIFKIRLNDHIDSIT